MTETRKKDEKIVLTEEMLLEILDVAIKGRTYDQD